MISSLLFYVCIFKRFLALLIIEYISELLDLGFRFVFVGQNCMPLMLMQATKCICYNVCLHVSDRFKSNYNLPICPHLDIIVKITFVRQKVHLLKCLLVKKSSNGIKSKFQI